MIFRHKHTCLEGSLRGTLITFFQQNNRRCFPTGTYDLPSHRFLSCLLVPDMKSFLQSGPYIQCKKYSSHPCQQSHQCTSMHILQSKLVFQHAGFIAERECWLKFSTSRLHDPHPHPGSIKASQQGGSFQFTPSLTSPCPTGKAYTCSIFSNRTLLSCPGIQPTAVAAAFRFVGLPWPAAHKELAYPWYQGFHSTTYGLWECPFALMWGTFWILISFPLTQPQQGCKGASFAPVYLSAGFPNL